MSKTELIVYGGNEPNCPACGNSNAMLHKMKWDPNEADQLECRDCKHTVNTDEVTYTKLTWNDTKKIFE